MNGKTKGRQKREKKERFKTTVKCRRTLNWGKIREKFSNRRRRCC